MAGFIFPHFGPSHDMMLPSLYVQVKKHTTPKGRKLGWRRRTSLTVLSILRNELYLSSNPKHDKKRELKTIQYVLALPVCSIPGIVLTHHPSPLGTFCKTMLLYKLDVLIQGILKKENIVPTCTNKQTNKQQQRKGMIQLPNLDLDAPAFGLDCPLSYCTLTTIWFLNIPSIGVFNLAWLIGRFHLSSFLVHRTIWCYQAFPYK